MNEIISVVMPCYNGEKTLQKTLDSVFAQSFQEFKLYCVNDGSTDGTAKILAQYALLNKNMVVIDKVNQGQTRAKNDALKVAKGKYIAFIDSDDVWDNEKLLYQYACMEKERDVGLCYTNGYYIDTDDHIDQKFGVETKLQGECLRELLMGNAIVASSVMIRAALLKKTGLFDENLSACENWELWTRFASHAKIAMIDMPLTHYRRHDDNMSHNIDKMRKNRLYVLEKNAQTYHNYFPDFNRLVKESFYKAHQFFGENYLWKLQLPKARKDLIQALRYKPFEKKLYYLLFKSFLGERLLSKIRSIVTNRAMLSMPE
ncbi:MAG: glycosyltransferase family 2 protein [Candidatus Berkiella sp.]